jgi:tetratricopeptide (TPR) repeat protein
MLLFAHPAAATVPPGASPEMAQALKLYEAARYHEAGVLFYRVLERQTPDKEKPRAEWWLGRTLYHQGFYLPALSFFDRAVQRQGGKYHLAVVKWLVSLAEKLPVPDAVEGKLGSYRTDLTKVPMLKRVRDAVRFHLGRRHYHQGSFIKAVALLAAVDPKSALYPKARLLEGIAHVRTMKARAAAAAFKAAIRAAVKPPTSREKKRLAELGRINLARLFYSVGQHRLAVKHYGPIAGNRGSRRRGGALLERSWALFNLGQHRRALADLRAARGLRGTNDLESYLLEAVVYHTNCRYRRCRAVVRRFGARFGPLQKKLAALARHRKDPSVFFGYAKRILAGKAGLKGDLARLARVAIGDRQLKRRFDLVREIDRELGLVRAAPASWRSKPLAGVVLQDLTLQRSLAVNETGQLAQLRIGKLARELATLIGQMRKVTLEADTQLKEGKPPAGCDKL